MTSTKRKIIMEFLGFLNQYEDQISNSRIRIYYFGNGEIYICCKNIRKSLSKNKIIELLNDYRKMDEVSFILAHGRDPFGLIEDYDLYEDLFDGLRILVEKHNDQS